MEQKGYNIKLRAIELVSKNLTLNEEVIKHSTIDFSFSFLVDVKIGPSEKVAIANTFMEVKDKSGAKLSDITTLCVFEFPEFEKAFPVIGENEYDMDIELEVFLKSTAIATTRGILFSELRGTFLHNAILPIVNIRPIIIADREKKELNRKKKD